MVEGEFQGLWRGDDVVWDGVGRQVFIPGNCTAHNTCPQTLFRNHMN